MARVGERAGRRQHLLLLAAHKNDATDDKQKLMAGSVDASIEKNEKPLRNLVHGINHTGVV